MNQKRRIVRKTIIPVVLFALFGISGSCQNPGAQSEFWDNVRYGGGVGVGFNNAGFNASVSPSAIYQFSNQFSAGIALNFIYSKINDDKLVAYGGGLVSFYTPLDFLQLSAEFEQLRVNREVATNIGVIDIDDWVPSLYLGIGYRSRNFTVGMRYDVLYDDETSIYLNPWAPFVRFYF